MEISQMKYFLEAAKTQHITNSAKNLHIAQPALTQSIHRLEDELGVPLFVPKGRNIVLTQYGVYLKSKLEPIIKEIDGISEALTQMANTENETVRLSVLAASTLVTKAIIDYKRINPNINFHVLQNPENELFDIEITTNLFYDKNEDILNQFVCTEKIFLAVPDNEKYKGRTSISLAEVKDEGFISLFGSKQLRSICDKFCHHAGFTPEIIFESDSPYAVKNMISANMGVGFWPEFTWGKMKKQNVRLLEISEPDCRRDILICYRQTKADNSHTYDFYKFLINYFK